MTRDGATQIWLHLKFWMITEIISIIQSFNHVYNVKIFLYIFLKSFQFPRSVLPCVTPASPTLSCCNKLQRQFVFLSNGDFELLECKLKSIQRKSPEHFIFNGYNLVSRAFIDNLLLRYFRSCCKSCEYWCQEMRESFIIIFLQ